MFLFDTRKFDFFMQVKIMFLFDTSIIYIFLYKLYECFALTQLKLMFLHHTRRINFCINKIYVLTRHK